MWGDVVPPKKKQVNQAALDMLRKLKDDFEFYANKILKIRTKEGELVPFELNSSQRRLLAEIKRQEELGLPIRIIILKSRQIGFSTLTEGVLFHRTTLNKLVNSMVVAHVDDASTNLFNMSKLYYEELPEQFKPMRKASNAKEIVFENPSPSAKEKAKQPGLRSKIVVQTAGAKGLGRSFTTHNLHISELAFFPGDVKQTMTGLLQAVPNSKKSMIVIESTANGVGGYFYDMWQLAKEGKSDFIPLFFPWHEHEEYRMPIPDGFMLDPEERELKAMYRLEDEQLVWRRWCIANNCSGDVDQFKQEYPSNDLEAFLSSGRPIFNIEVLNAMKEDTRPPKHKGNLIVKDGRVQFTDNKQGFISIWKRPKEGAEYIISADVAEGLSHGDYSVADVIDRKTLEQVAQWHGHIDPDLFGDEIEKLAKFYNLAFVAVEANNHGLTTITALKNLNYRRMYRRRTVDKITNKSVAAYGWQTNSKTKPLMIDKLAEMIRERLVTINCKETVEECITYKRDDKGRMGAEQGRHDDRVISLAIGLYVANEIPWVDIEDDYEVECEVAFGNTGY